MTNRGSIHFATSANSIACQTRGRRLTCTTDRLAVLRGDAGTCRHCRNALAEQDRQRCIALYRELGMAA